MTEDSHAIFLSYASQDAEIARRLADALRAAGLEVWFDQSELRGGDAWDVSIRKRIEDCTLFVPVISKNTETRSEGCFRLEWKPAVDRSHLVSDDQTVNRRRGLTSVRRRMLTMRKRDKLTILIEKCLLNSGQASMPVRSQAWSRFDACSHGCVTRVRLPCGS